MQNGCFINPNEVLVFKILVFLRRKFLFRISYIKNHFNSLCFFSKSSLKIADGANKTKKLCTVSSQSPGLFGWTKFVSKS